MEDNRGAVSAGFALVGGASMAMAHWPHQWSNAIDPVPIIAQ